MISPDNSHFVGETCLNILAWFTKDPNPLKHRLDFGTCSNPNIIKRVLARHLGSNLKKHPLNCCRTLGFREMKGA